MFAVIKTGGKQYKVAPNDILRIEKVAGQPGDTVELDAVLAVGSEAGVTLGAPLVEGAMVATEVIEQGHDIVGHLVNGVNAFRVGGAPASSRVVQDDFQKF